MYLRKIIKILLDLARAVSADSQVLWRAGAKCKTATMNSRSQGHPAQVCHKGCVHPIGSGVGVDRLELISVFFTQVNSNGTPNPNQGSIL